MKSKADIIKIGAAVIRNKKLLITKPYNKNMFIILGGKPEKKESDIQCLRREIMEEVKVQIKGTPKLYLTSPIEPAAGRPELTVQIKIYLVELHGEPKPTPDDIKKIHWISQKEFVSGKFQLGTILQDYLLPKLIKDGLLKLKFFNFGINLFYIFFKIVF